MSLFSFLTQDLAIDLGTANTLIIHKDQVVVDEPSIIAVNRRNGNVIAVGSQAQQMHGKVHEDIKTIRPLKDGVIADFQAAEHMIRGMISMIPQTNKFIKPQQRMVICIPSGITEVEKRAVKDSAERAGAKEVYLIHEPMAAAIGIGIDVFEPMGNMIIDIGGGTTEIAVISMGGTVTSKSLKIAGDRLTDDILRFVRDEFKLAIGEPTAEELKINIGSAMPLNEKMELSIRGRDLATGLPRETIVRDTHVRAAIIKSLKSILEAVKEVIEVSPPELAGDILKRGVYMCGGGSLLKGMDALLSRELGVAVNIVDDPLTCVARGTGVAVENLAKYQLILDNPLRPRDIKI